jgi:hypothetical protein
MNMKKILGPAGITLVGAAFIFLILCMSSAAVPTSPPNSMIKELHSSFINDPQDLNKGTLALSGDTICFPWASKRLSSNKVGVQPGSRAELETISLIGSRPWEQLQDLKAFNGVRQRDIEYKEVQNGSCKPSGLGNAMDVSVTGSKQKKNGYHEHEFDDNKLERFVDNKFGLDPRNGQGSGSIIRGNPATTTPGNYLNIDVSDITVSAVNTVEGGSAVATSNIIIKPIQLIVYPSEVEEKLK